MMATVPLRRDLVQLAFEDWFGITASESKLLVVLFENGGVARPCRDLAIALDSHRPPSSGLLALRVHALRGALKTEAIDTHPGRQYGLTETGLEECRKALFEMAQVLMAVAHDAAA